jgi:hypothetical protein
MADQVLVDAVPRIDLANLIEELKKKESGELRIPKETGPF